MRPILPLASPHAVHSAAEFDEIVKGSPLTVLVDFWAPRGFPTCKSDCDVERIARDQAGGAVIAKVNTDEVPDIALRFGIVNVPTFVVFRDGRELTRIEGVHPASDLLHAMSA
jgi:thioredoxin-like negative regulator of GroEL